MSFKQMMRGGKPVPRNGGPTPCWKCPKQSPEIAATIELSTKNERAFAYYRMARAPLGEQLAADSITHRNNAIIDQIVRDSDQAALAMIVLAAKVAR